MRRDSMRKKTISLQNALLVAIAALAVQYFLLEGAAIASNSKYFSILSPSLVNYEHLQYTVNDYNIQLEIPKATEVQVSPDLGEEMQSSIYFTNSALGFRGYLQIWKLKDLEYFLNNSKNLSPFDFISYNMSSLQQNYHEGFQTEWSVDFGEKVISGQEFWWKLNNPEEVVRVSFFSDTADFPDSLDSVIQYILNTIQVDSQKVI